MKQPIKIVPANADWQPNTVSYLMARYNAPPNDIEGFVDSFFDEACPHAKELREERERQERKTILLAEKRRLDEMLAEMERYTTKATTIG